MRDVPVIFSAPMVRALLDGRKTMTRRLAWLPPRDPSTKRIKDCYQRVTPWQNVEPGDRLWVRENLAVMGNWGVWHDASDPPSDGKFLDDIDPRARTLLDKYAPVEATDSCRIPSIHMPRWASRLTLIVTATKIEKLRDISEADAIREGVSAVDIDNEDEHLHSSASDQFRLLWESLHGKGSWDANPEVVALTFEVELANIDKARTWGKLETAVAQEKANL